MKRNTQALRRHFFAALDLEGRRSVGWFVAELQKKQNVSIRQNHVYDVLNGHRNGEALLLRIRDFTLAAYRRHKIEPPENL